MHSGVTCHQCLSPSFHAFVTSVAISTRSTCRFGECRCCSRPLMRLARGTNFAKGYIMQSLVKVLIHGQMLSIQTIQRRRTYAGRTCRQCRVCRYSKENPYLPTLNAIHQTKESSHVIVINSAQSAQSALSAPSAPSAAPPYLAAQHQHGKL